jgi:hypothetical protein
MGLSKRRPETKNFLHLLSCQRPSSAPRSSSRYLSSAVHPLRPTLWLQRVTSSSRPHEELIIPLDQCREKENAFGCMKGDHSPATSHARAITRGSVATTSITFLHQLLSRNLKLASDLSGAGITFNCIVICKASATCHSTRSFGTESALPFCLLIQSRHVGEHVHDVALALALGLRNVDPNFFKFGGPLCRPIDP